MSIQPEVNKDNLIWIDLEMTGLIPEEDFIIEVATIVTDKELNVLAEGPSLAVYQPDSVLDAMDEWNTEHHNASGLVARVKASEYKAADAERLTIEFLSQWVPAGTSPMCGNTICQDRRFLARHMPDLEEFFHYRHIDVSTLKELAARWAPDIPGGFAKKGAHLAMDDIRESIAELAYYRQQMLSI